MRVLARRSQRGRSASAAPSSIVRAIDRRLGGVVGGAIVAHHRRRLSGLEQLGALDAPSDGWAETGTPPRSGCSLEVLTDGAEALPRIVEELRKAQSHVHLAGWQVEPEFALTRGEEPTIVRSLLGELSSRIDVRILTWGGAPLPLFRPSRRAVRRARERCCARSDVDWALDSRERPLHCHHEKTIVIDDRLAFVGGIDLTAESGDRFDSVAHVARGHLGWHDVASLVRGPAVADVAEHFRMRWHEVTGKTIPRVSAVEETGDLDVQIIRTIPEHIYSAVPRGEFGILESYVRALRSARRLIYLENQFLWSPEITAIVADKLRRPPDDRFRVLIVLPSKPNTGADDTRGSLGALIEADNGAGRLLACTLYAHEGAFSDPIYVHAKVAIVDDHWLTIGSANLNDHSLFNDTEMNVVIRDHELATNTRHRLWAEHLELPISTIAGEPANAIDTLWKPISALQLDHLSTGRPLTRRPVRLPNLSRSSERLLGPLQGLLVDG